MCVGCVFSGFVHSLMLNWKIFFFGVCVFQRLLEFQSSAVISDVIFRETIKDYYL